MLIIKEFQNELSSAIEDILSIMYYIFFGLGHLDKINKLN